MNHDILSNNIEKIRLSLGENKREFGERFNATGSLVSKWEKGLITPSPERLKSIADLGGVSVSELLYGSIEDYLLNEINTFFENQEGVEFSPEGKSEVIKDALQQSVNNPLINATFGEDSQLEIFNSLVNEEISKAILRRLNLTDFTNEGFIRKTLLELTDTKNELKNYLNNGINENLYDETISIINEAYNAVKGLKEKY